MNDDQGNYSPLREEKERKKSDGILISPENNGSSPTAKRGSGPLYQMIQQEAIYTSSFGSQLRGLFKKNMSLQAKQMGTNICQIVTPIICLLFVYLIKVLASQHIPPPETFSVSVPFMMNVPYSKIYGGKHSPFLFTTCLQWYLYDFQNANANTQPYVNNMLEDFFSNTTEFNSWFECPAYNNTMMPYFAQPVNGSINNQLFENLEYLNEQPYHRGVDVTGLDVMPDGAITFYEASSTNLSFKIQINDNRIPEYHRGNGVTKLYLVNGNTTTQQVQVADGQLILLDLISRAYLKTVNDDVMLLSGIQYMPISADTSSLLDKIFSLTGASLYPIALSLLLPVFMYAIVLEKEERLQEMMKMNGLKMRYYWIVNYVWNLTLYLLASLIFYIFGRYILVTSFFTDTGSGPMFAIILGWGLAQVSLSFFFQNFLAKARSATIAGYLLSIWTTMFGISFNLGVWPDPQKLPAGLVAYPPFAFCRLIYDFSMKCSNNLCIKSSADFDDEITNCLISLYLGAVIFMVLGIYLNEVWPQEFGVRKHPLFFLKACLKKNKVKNIEYTEVVNENGVGIDMNGEDEDSRKEKKFVEELTAESYSNYPLIVKNIRKVYKAVGGRPPKVAVKNLSLHINKGEMFGLLGPNGAGKTTLISMITGLYPPEAGNAWVAGYDIISQIEYARSQMGVCPQFDLLWPDLTVAEHLYFYARIRGVPPSAEDAVVEKAMKEVYLAKFASFRVRQLSGGMKRRLSVAISLVGDPKIVFLDEPTTGLDPENRRQLWDILVEARGNRAMVLTTHSMEEADVLCTRIGIITDGVLRCVGPQTRLKTLYGGGYHLFINCHKDTYLSKHNDLQKVSHSLEYYHQKVLETIPQILPRAVMKSAFNGNFLFLVPLEGLEVSKIFEELESRRQELAICDWGISQSTLEDVFMEIVSTSENIEPERE